MVHHPFIMSPIDFIAEQIDNLIIYGIVMEKATGDLASYIDANTNDPIPENVCAIIAYRILNAISYLHGLNIVHRDIKPQNILYFEGYSADDIINVRLTDFGLSVPLDGDGLTSGVVGTIPYLAPEVIAKTRYGRPADMWSLGVTIYYLLTNLQLFDESNSTVLRVEISRCDFDLDNIDDVSNEAKDFLKKILRKNPSKRLTAEAALQHPWFDQARAIQPFEQVIPLPLPIDEDDEENLF